MAYPKGINKAHDSFSLFLNVPDNESLPTGWRRHAKVSFSLVNQGSEKLSQRKGYYFLYLLATLWFMLVLCFCVNL